jgi:hypothetical protein
MGHFTPEGLASIKVKLTQRLTPERRRQFAEDTRTARRLAEQARKRAADVFAKLYAPMIETMQDDGMTVSQIVARLNATGHLSRRGGPWTDQTVRQVLKRMAKRFKDLRAEVMSPRRLIGWDRRF